MSCKTTTLMALGLVHKVCIKCKEPTWCVPSPVIGGPVCLKCCSLSSENVRALEKKIKEIENEGEANTEH